MRGNQGWSTLGAVGAGRPKGDRPPRKTHSYRATPAEHELVRRFIRLVRIDISGATEAVEILESKLGM